MPGLQTFLKDKAYDFVPLLDECKKSGYIPHNIMEKGTYNGKLKLRIHVLSPLHIGGRMQDYDINGNIIKKQVRRNGKIVIPGSSLKGAIRSVAEAVSYSCAVKVPDNVLKRILPKNNYEQCSDINNGLCMVCSIFGMTNGEAAYKGKVNFGEFILIDGGLEKVQIPSLESPFKNYPPKHDVFYSNNRTNKKYNYGNERLYYCKACKLENCQNCSKEKYFENIEIAGKEREMAFRGRKFYNANGEEQTQTRKKTCCEMIVRGSIMEGELIFQNLRREEGKLLAYALDINNDFTMKLGYGKPLGYGRVKICLEKVVSAGSRYPGAGGLDEKIIRDWSKEYRENSSDEIKRVISKLEEIMR